MAMIRSIVVIAAAALVPLVAAAQVVYLGRDAQGNVTLTKEPPPGFVPGSASRSKRPASVSRVPGKQGTAAKKQPGPSAVRELPAAAGGELVLYAAAWCPHCRNARAYLQENGIAYTDIDIDSPAGKEAYAAVDEGQGIPLLMAGDRRAVGFGAEYYAWFLRKRR